MSIAAYRDSVTEADMTKGIADVVRLCGGRLFHLRDARRAPELEDMPDLIVICPPVVGLFELKSARRRVTPGQIEVAQLLSRCDRIAAGLVRPADYDRVLELLRGEG